MLHSVLYSGPSPDKECIPRMFSDIVTSAWPLRAVMYTSTWMEVLFAEIIATDEIKKKNPLVFFGGYCTSLSRICSISYIIVVGKIKTVCISVRTRMELIIRLLMCDFNFQISLKSFQQFLRQTRKHRNQQDTPFVNGLEINFYELSKFLRGYSRVFKQGCRIFVQTVIRKTC